MSRYEVLKEMYHFGETIGSGGFAKVKLAVHLLTGEQVAIKIMDKKKLGAELPRVETEIKAMKQLVHQHICQLYQVIETQDKYFLVLEYCPNGELFDYIVAHDRLEEDQARYFFRQILSALAYIHHNGFAHRDLKPENLLLDEKQNIKVIDFGLCIKPAGGINSKISTCCGSPAYAAPELISGKLYLGREADIWSLGILLYALLCGFLPFDDENTGLLYKKIQTGLYSTPPWLSAGSKHLISRMLQVEPRCRIKMDDLLRHPWVICGTTFRSVPWMSQLQLRDFNEECLNVLCLHYKQSKEDIRKHIQLDDQNYLAASYKLLLVKQCKEKSSILKQMKVTYNNESNCILSEQPSHNVDQIMHYENQKTENERNDKFEKKINSNKFKDKCNNILKVTYNVIIDEKIEFENIYNVGRTSSNNDNMNNGNVSLTNELNINGKSDVTSINTKNIIKNNNKKHNNDKNKHVIQVTTGQVDNYGPNIKLIYISTKKEDGMRIESAISPMSSPPVTDSNECHLQIKNKEKTIDQLQNETDQCFKCDNVFKIEDMDYSPSYKKMVVEGVHGHGNLVAHTLQNSDQNKTNDNSSDMQKTNKSVAIEEKMKVINNIENVNKMINKEPQVRDYINDMDYCGTTSGNNKQEQIGVNEKKIMKGAIVDVKRLGLKMDKLPNVNCMKNFDASVINYEEPNQLKAKLRCCKPTNEENDEFIFKDFRNVHKKYVANKYDELPNCSIQNNRIEHRCHSSHWTNSQLITDNIDYALMMCKSRLMSTTATKTTSMKNSETMITSSPLSSSSSPRIVDVLRKSRRRSHSESNNDIEGSHVNCSPGSSRPTRVSYMSPSRKLTRWRNNQRRKGPELWRFDCYKAVNKEEKKLLVLETSSKSNAVILDNFTENNLKNNLHNEPVEMLQNNKILEKIMVATISEQKLDGIDVGLKLPDSLANNIKSCKRVLDWVQESAAINLLSGKDNPKDQCNYKLMMKVDGNLVQPHLQNDVNVECDVLRKTHIQNHHNQHANKNSSPLKMNANNQHVNKNSSPLKMNANNSKNRRIVEFENSLAPVNMNEKLSADFNKAEFKHRQTMDCSRMITKKDCNEACAMSPCMSCESHLDLMSQFKYHNHDGHCQVDEDTFQAQHNYLHASVDTELDRLHKRWTTGSCSKKADNKKVIPLEKGVVNRIISIFTPKKKQPNSSNPRKIKTIHNVHSTNLSKADIIIHKLKTILNERKISFKENGFNLKCGVFDTSNQPIILFNLEVVQVSKCPTLGIYRKRLSGDVWYYKRLCEIIFKSAHL